MFGSFSWSANVVGEKEWLFFPPGQESNLLSPKHDGSKHIFNVAEVIPKTSSAPSNELQTFEWQGNQVCYYRITQEKEDIVFVPSGWFHQVRNIRDTISINHNWFNSTNAMKVYYNLGQELKNVQNEINDCKETTSPEEWEEMCQSLLKASYGMNHNFLYRLCCDMLKLKMKQYSTCTELCEKVILKHELQGLYDVITLLKEEHCSTNICDLFKLSEFSNVLNQLSSEIDQTSIIALNN